LTIDDVAMVIETDIGTGTAAYLPQREHLARCHECRHAAEIYADILRADTTTYDIDLDVELYTRRRVTLPSDIDEPVEIVLLNQGLTSIETINPASVILRGPVLAEGCTVWPLSANYGAREAAALRFPTYETCIPRHVTALCDRVILEGVTFDGDTFR